MNKSKNMTQRGGYRSLFWPMLLIGAGVIWLMVNVGIIPAFNLNIIFRLWPIILIAIGIDLLIGRNSPVFGALVGAGTVALFIVLLMVGPALGIVQTTSVQHTTINEGRNGAESAEIVLNLSIGETTITALDRSDNLIEADLATINDVEFDVSGSSHKTVTIGVEDNNTIGFNINMPVFFGGESNDLYWNISLSPDIPLQLSVGGGVGETVLNLEDINLTGLDVSGGVGNTDVTLPATGNTYTAIVDGGVGETTITLSDGAEVAVNVSGGVGGVTINVPNDASVRVESNGGLGGTNVPNRYDRISGEGNDGVWESPDYEDGEGITIYVDGGVGGITIR